MNIFNLFSYRNHPSKKAHTSRIYPNTPVCESNLPTPYTYNENSHKRISWQNSQGLDFFPRKKDLNIFNLFSYMNHPSENPHSSHTFIPTPHFLRTLFPNVLYSQRKLSQVYQLAEFTRSGLFSYQTTGTNRDGINYLHLPSDRKRMANPSISSKSNLLELFLQATFPQCYITYSQNLTYWISSDGLDFFPIE